MDTTAKHILIVENDEGLSQALVIRLEDCGYRCTTASSGAQGIASFTEYPYDAVITDLNMPNGSGIELCKSIRQISNAPILIITGFESYFSQELRDCKGTSVLPKPFEFQSLLDELEIMLELGTLQVE